MISIRSVQGCFMTHLSDLVFQDIHYMALDKGETALAEVARRKAEQVDSESLGILKRI